MLHSTLLYGWGLELFVHLDTLTHPVMLSSSLNFRDFNNGVYRAGFAKTQEAYDTAVREVFGALDQVEEILSHHRYLVGSQLTEADVRMYTTLVRFDLVYVGVFRVSNSN